MKVLLSWLGEWIDLEGRSAQVVAAELESLGHEVDQINERSLTNVVVGEILSIAKHPNADKLSVAQVNVGQRTIQLIFGQYFPVAVGDRLPVALAPCRLPTGLEIEARTIRGVDSQGMLAADGELGRHLTEEGILRFDTTVKPGTAVAQLIDWQEISLDISITPNRGDVLSLRGLARDLAARWGSQVRLPSPQLTETSTNTISVQVETPHLCPRYTARRLTGIRVSQAPSVLSGRLGMLGHGIYNSVVDVTNAVMEEFGVPLHAFDADTITGSLVVRLANQGESIKLLDGKIYELDNTMLVIADQTGPVALAGIMGGLKTAITKATTNLILEAAVFHPATIRKTRQKLKLTSDAAYRFERGVDPAVLELASRRASALILGETGQAGPLTIVGDVAPSRTISFDPDTINRQLGTAYQENQMQTILERLGFQVDGKVVVVPSWRHDVSLWQDLSEEVARIAGYDALPRQNLAHEPLVANPDNTQFHQVEWLKDQLVHAGWTEHIGSSFISEADCRLLEVNQDNLVRLANPVSLEAAYLRPTLTMSLLRAVARNPIFSTIRLFEVGTVWQDGQEQTVVGFIWNGQDSYQVPVLDQAIGQAVNQTYLAKLKIRRPLMFAELPLAVLLKEIPPTVMELSIPEVDTDFKQPSRYQSVIRDIAVLVEQTISPETIAAELRTLPQVVDVELFDQFSNSKLADRQSLAFHLLIEHPDRSLTTDEIETIVAEATQLMISRFSATIR